MTQQAKQQIVEAVPSIAAILTWVAGIPIEKWAALAGLVFIVVQTLGYVWRLRVEMARERERIRRGEPPPPPIERSEL